MADGSSGHDSPDRLPKGRRVDLPDGGGSGYDHESVPDALDAALRHLRIFHGRRRVDGEKSRYTPSLAHRSQPLHHLDPVGVTRPLPSLGDVADDVRWGHVTHDDP